MFHDLNRNNIFGLSGTSFEEEKKKKAPAPGNNDVNANNPAA